MKISAVIALLASTVQTEASSINQTPPSQSEIGETNDAFSGLVNEMQKDEQDFEEV